jgi:hypothetical protein
MDESITLSLSSSERELLVDILSDRLGTLREEVYHSSISTYKDALKAREVVLRGIIDRLATPAG